MGQKVHPIGFRLGVNASWKSTWYKNPSVYAEALHEDLKLRKAVFTLKELEKADISKIEITRSPGKILFYVHTSRPGILIGPKGENIDKITKNLQNNIKSNNAIQIKIVEIKKPEIDAKSIANSIAKRLKQREAFRKILKTTIANARKSGVQGIKIQISGRLNGADMARTESLKDGRVPLHTLRADIDYALSEAITTYGVVGIKVWICLGEVLKKTKRDNLNNREKRVSRAPKSVDKNKKKPFKRNDNRSDNRRTNRPNNRFDKSEENTTFRPKKIEDNTSSNNKEGV